MQPSVGRMVYYKSYGTPGGEYSSEDRTAGLDAFPERASRKD